MYNKEWRVTMDESNGLLVDPDTGEILKTNSGKRVRARGSREIYMQKDGVYEKFMTSLSSGLEIRVAIDIMRDVDKNGVLKYAVKHYETVYKTSRSTISKVISKAKSAGLLLPAGRRMYLNPYAVLPYNIKDVQANQLQQQWDKLYKIYDDKGKLTRQDALEVMETVFGNEVVGSR